MFGRRKFRTREARRREHKRLAILYGIGAVILSLVLALVAYGMQWHALRIQHIAVETDGVLDTKAVTALIQESLNSNALWLFPRDSSFLVHTNSLEARVAASFPRAAEVTVRRAGLTTLAAHITERTPSALWCGDVVPQVAYTATIAPEERTEDMWGTCYLIDVNGYMYDRAPLYTGNIFPRYYGPLDSAEPVGQQFLLPSEFDRWQLFFEALHESNLEPLAVLFVDERDAELYLANGLRIQLPRDDNLDLIRRRLLATIEGDTIDLARTIEYLDLRFGSKAFVRYVDEVEEMPTVE